jgi:hypothetical protein
MAEFHKHTFTLFAHTNREHASTSSQIVAKFQLLFPPFSALVRKAVAPGVGILRQFAARQRVNE